MGKVSQCLSGEMAVVSERRKRRWPHLLLLLQVLVLCLDAKAFNSEGKEEGDQVKSLSPHIAHEGLLIVGGTNKDQDSEGTLALLDRSLCYALSPLPEKRRAGLFAQVNETSLLYCGGRKSLLEINTECWTYSKDSWTVSEPLPRAIAGATSLGLGTKVWVFGGVIEEDYYDSYYITKESEAEPSQLDYYDYVIEETGNDIYMYDGEKWTSSGTSLPQPLQGSCAVEFAGQILLIAGKNEKDLWQGSKSVWQFDPENETWAHHQGWWPLTNWPHFYHGCSQAVVKGVPGIVVAGGQGCGCIHEGCSTKVEFLTLPSSLGNIAHELDKGLDGSVKWETLPDLHFPHAYTPAVAYVKEKLYVVGGGNFDLTMASDKIEMFENGQWWSFGALPMRSFGSSLGISAASAFIQGCQLEPNLGIHGYYQRRTTEKLKGKQWICDAEQLLYADQEEQPINFMESCTIPGCHYPHPFRQKVQKSSINCQIKGLASPQYHVECAMACRKGWKPLDDIDSTICSPLNLPLDRKKLTNFTMDYLECEKIL